MKGSTCIAVAVILAISPIAQAQEVAKPGPEHETLKKLEGTWQTKMKIADKEYKGAVEYKMGLGGLWLCGKMESDCPQGTFTGMSHDTYDAKKGKHVSIWLDSHSTTPMVLEGTCDKEKKTTTLTGEGPGPDGKMTKHKAVWQVVDDNTLNFAMYMGEGQEPIFTVQYTRNK